MAWLKHGATRSICRCARLPMSRRLPKGPSRPPDFKSTFRQEEIIRQEGGRPARRLHDRGQSPRSRPGLSRRTTRRRPDSEGYQREDRRTRYPSRERQEAVDGGYGIELVRNQRKLPLLCDRENKFSDLDFRA